MKAPRGIEALFVCYNGTMEEYYKNVFYLGESVNGLFTGMLSWVRNVGKAFGKQYDLTLIYDAAPEKTLNDLKQYFRCVKFDKNKIYICNRLITTYKDYHYPKNIVAKKKFVTIHGVMKDFPHAAKYTDDLYDRYIACSKTAADGAKGYFPGEVEYIYNPIVVDNVKPRLYLVSAQRSSKVKGLDRLEKVAKVLDDAEIPYTWDVFTDAGEGTNKGGLVFRHRVSDPLPYTRAADYFVLLSDTEACPYGVLEAINLGVKMILTPAKVYKEWNLDKSPNVHFLDFDDFTPENADRLREKVLKIVSDNQSPVSYETDYDFSGYEDLFIS